MNGPIAAIYEGTPGLRVSSAHMRFIGSTAEELVATAAREVAAGASRIQLCGAVGVAEATEVRRAVPSDVHVELVRYGYESLDLITAYKQSVLRGDIPDGREVFLYLDSTADPVVERVDHEDAAFIPVADVAAVTRALTALREEQAQELSLVELYGGLGLDAAAAAWAATEGKTPVGFIDRRSWATTAGPPARCRATASPTNSASSTRS